MAKLYSKRQKTLPKIQPKKETISFLLNYSKALKIFDTQLGRLEIIAN